MRIHRVVHRIVAGVIGCGVAPLLVLACSSDTGTESPTTTSSAPTGDHHQEQHRDGSGSGSGAEAPRGHWDDDGQPVHGGPVGADGSTGNNLTREYCARNEDPGCPAGSYVGPNAILSPDGSNTYVPCEGTICTNPNHGAGDDPESIDPPTDDAPEDTFGDSGDDSGDDTTG